MSASTLARCAAGTGRARAHWGDAAHPPRCLSLPPPPTPLAGNVEELPEGAASINPNANRIRSREDAAAVAAPSLTAELEERAGSGTPPPGRIRFTDKDEHMYFWFPLLAGLSELTFDPRPEIRCACAPTAHERARSPGASRARPARARPPRRTSSLEVLFDILQFHGGSFTPQFWLRIFDSVLLPIFDHVRAEVTGERPPDAVLVVCAA